MKILFIIDIVVMAVVALLLYDKEIVFYIEGACYGIGLALAICIHDENNKEK